MGPSLNNKNYREEYLDRMDANSAAAAAAVEIGKDSRSKKRYSFASIATAATLALALGAAPLVACSASSTDTSTSTSASAAASESADAAGSNGAPSGAAPSDASGQAPSGQVPSEQAPGASGSDGSTPPEMPSGEAPQANGGEPPALPDGENGQGGMSEGGTPPAMPAGESGQGGMGGANTMSFDYSGEYTGAASADGEETTLSSETVTATESDQNAGLAANGGTLTASGTTFEKSGDDTDGDRCNFYGVNSIVLAVNDSSKAVISNALLTATSQGSNALFATDSGTVYANASTIETHADNSRGLDATYDGTIVANELSITTEGDHCAAVATDRGGGNISVTNSTFSTAGSGSPLLYSTGDIEVDSVSGTSTGSQIVGMEGLNTVMISNSTLTSKQTGKTASDPIADGIIIYQSTSGDAEASTGDTALFQASDSTLSSAIESGSMFYLTNTTAKVVLSKTTLDFDSTAANLIVAAGNDSNNWGSAGRNGATVTFTGINQQLSGNVEVDTISSVDFYLLENSSWKGASTITENATASTDGDHLNVNIDANSTWTVTADSTVSNLNIATGGKLVDESGATVNVKDSDGNTLVDGTSEVTVTVTGAFSTTVTTSEANELEAADIDRTDFDSTFGITTTFGQNGSAANSSTGVDEETQAAIEAARQAVLEWFANLDA